jgi:hypothetical protein
MRKGSSPITTFVRQGGQALIYGLFVLVAGLAAFFFLFNSGQLVREKTKLVNTADAATYAASIMDARTLNFMAYTNRAMLANTVAIAQLVSISSWVQYAIALGTWGTSSGDMTRYAVFYPSFQTAQRSAQSLQRDLVENDLLKNLALASDKIIQQALVHAQQQAYAGLHAARQQIADDVAQANYRNDGSVSVEQLAKSQFIDALHYYRNEERSRFGDVAQAAAFKDGFLPKRSWIIPATFSACTPMVDWLARRGGTEMVSLDQWQAVDTMSDWQWVRYYFYCFVNEIPQGAGLQDGSEEGSTDLDPTHYDYSLAINPTATMIATTSNSGSWDYSGIPSFYDLSAAGMAKPAIRSAVRVKRTIDQTTSSEGRSSVVSTPRLNAYRAAPADDNALIAVSASEAYFERPDTNEPCEDGSIAQRDNCYGRKNGKPTEAASLFNPYWQVRLVSPNEYADKRLMEEGTRP